MQTRRTALSPNANQMRANLRSTLQYIEKKLMDNKTITELDMSYHNNPVRESRHRESFSFEPGALPNLLSINLYDANLGLTNLLVLLKAAPNLTRLNLSKTNYSREDILTVLADEKSLFDHLYLNKLKVIDISGCNMVDSDLANYAAGRNICISLLGFLLQSASCLETLITNSTSITFKNDLYHMYTMLHNNMDHAFSMRQLASIYESGILIHNQLSGERRVVVEKNTFLARGIYRALYNEQVRLRNIYEKVGLAEKTRESEKTISALKAKMNELTIKLSIELTQSVASNELTLFHQAASSAKPNGRLLTGDTSSSKRLRQ